MATTFLRLLFIKSGLIAHSRTYASALTIFHEMGMWQHGVVQVGLCLHGGRRVGLVGAGQRSVSVYTGSIRGATVHLG